MDFLLFQLLFAAVMLALLAVLIAAVRATLRTRRLQGGPPRTPSWPRSRASRAAGAPEPAGPPKTERRRRIGPAAKSAEESAGDHAGETEAAADQRPDPAAAPGLSAPDAAACAFDAPFRELVMVRLEESFDRYTSGRITLPDYVALVRGQQAEVDFHISELRRTAESGDADPLTREERIDDALCARDAIEWCLEWAEGLSHGEPA